MLSAYMPVAFSRFRTCSSIVTCCLFPWQVCGNGKGESERRNWVRFGDPVMTK
jgi:hypothetical protein